MVAIQCRQFHSRTLLLSRRHCYNLLLYVTYFASKKYPRSINHPTSYVGLFIYRSGAEPPKQAVPCSKIVVACF